tara:strand:- start:10 stop:1551 length:1542 start_codon:yes stop_codon:yes gene_type:complete
MADKVVLEAEVKSNIGEVSKDASSLAGEFKIMGVSLNSVKAGFVSVGKTAKASFATIKAGIMSTGIGALLIAVTSLISYFTNTKRGADKLAQTFTAMGAVVDVLTDRLSKVGEAISYVFSGEFRKAGEALKGTFAGITKEIKEEVKAMVELTKRTQALRDADMEFMVQKAATRQEIEKARLNAEDETKSAAERLEALKTALELEEKTTKRELELARERLAIQQQEMELSENSAEDEEKLAQLKVELIEKETASIKMRRRVVTEVNSLENEIRAEEKARTDAKLAEAAKKITALEDEKKAADDLYDAQIASADKWLLKVEALALKEKELKERIAQSMYANLSSMLNSNLQAQGNSIEAQYNREIKLAEANGRDTEAIEEKYEGKRKALAEKQKKLKIGLATIDMFQSVIAAYNQGMGVPPPAGLVLGPASAGLALAAGLANINSIMQTDVGGGGGGGGVSGGTIGSGAPAPQMMSGAFELSGGVEPEAFKAYVVTDEMTNSQNQLANIRRRATI